MRSPRPKRRGSSRALRSSETLRQQLQAVVQERERGDHSIGAIWRMARLTCPSREQLGSYVLQVLDPGLQDYVEFHLKTIGCPYCQANLSDLECRQQRSRTTCSGTPSAVFRVKRGVLPK